jgi:GNAT superfamily N-acetyltransferase
MLSMPQAIDVVCNALALIHSITAPSEIVRHGPLWIMRDVNAKPGKARTEELFTWGVSPDEAVRAVKDYAPRGRYALLPYVKPNDDFDAVRSAYKALGYRALSTETLFVCPLANRKPVISAWESHRVKDMDEMKRVSKEVFGRATRKLRPQDLTDARPVMRMYYAEAEGRAVSVARSVMPRRGVTWMHDVRTVQSHRRRGIATALLRQVLDDDAALGSKHSVLLASTAGAYLYPLLGYQLRAILQLYAPLKQTR